MVFLVAQMRVCDVSKDVCEFMSSYLCDRYQRVKISNCRSSLTQLTKAIPQDWYHLYLNVSINDISYL